MYKVDKLEDFFKKLEECNREKYKVMIDEIKAKIEETATRSLNLALSKEDVIKLLSLSVKDVSKDTVRAVSGRFGSLSKVAAYFSQIVFRFGHQPIAWSVYIWFIPKGHSKENAELTMNYWIAPDFISSNS